MNRQMMRDRSTVNDAQTHEQYIDMPELSDHDNLQNKNINDYITWADQIKLSEIAKEPSFSG